MRRNALNQAYCHDADEVTQELETNELENTGVHVSNIDGPSGQETRWIGEVSDNDSGEQIFYIEADSDEQVREIAKAANIEITL